MNKGVMVEPLTLSIIERRLLSMAEEMGLKVMKSARSYVTAHVADLGTAIYDERERIVTQGSWLPAHVAGANITIKKLLDDIGRDNIYPGDFILGNDPYTVCSGHQPDWSFLYPAFLDGELIAYLYLRTHQFDTGGAFVGCYWPGAYDVHSESLIIPPTKIFERGQEKKDVYRLILKNVRGPEMMRADHMLIRGVMIKAEEKLRDIYRAYGKEVMKATYDELITLSEKMIRNEFSKWPAGVYKSQAASDSDGTRTDIPVWVRLTLTIKPDVGELVLDYTESDDQVDFINCNTAEVWANTIIPIRWSMPAGIPKNQALYNCITIKTRPGSVVEPLYPTTCGGMGPALGAAICESVQLALTQAIPEDVVAAWTRATQPIFEGKNPRVKNPVTGQTMDYFLVPFHSHGSSGAIWGYDGWDNLAFHITAGAVVRSPIEIDERDFPYRYLCSEWITDSPGDGRFRGGIGAHVEWLNLHDPKTYIPGDCLVSTGNSNGEKFAPFGLMGGRDAKKNVMWIKRRGKLRRLHSLVILPAEPGDIIITHSGGGGGVGEPLDREVEKVKEDALNEYISIKKAREVYGVIINPETFEVDYPGTEKLRSRKKRAKTKRAT